MKLIIKDLTITGFKGYKEAKAVVLGEKRTLISADNGIGKSSVGEAICWLFTGCDIYGNEKAATRLVNDDKPKITEVELNCIIDGTEKNIIRRKKGSTNGLFIDGSKADNSDLAELYKSKDIFLSIFNPYYFPSLAPKDAKQLLSEVLKPVPKEEVFQELGEYFTEILKKNNFKIPETFLSDKNAEIKEHKDNVIFLEGKISALEVKEAPEEKQFDILELEELQKKLDALKEGSRDNVLADLQAKQRDIEFSRN
ncbi:AAA family ATPase [Clostridium cellulovorans]|uniref:AAA family ATPase n=1 Tax=Clostridium cellulovorans TaxID=1493 RepID=UPI0001A96C3E|nr:AAA family ATPase [Clostridium cellulovorans]